MEIGSTRRSNPDTRRTDLSRAQLNKVWDLMHDFACGSMWSGLSANGVAGTLMDLGLKALHVGEIGEFKGQSMGGSTGQSVSSDHLVEACGEKVDLDESAKLYIIRNKDNYRISGPNDPTVAEEVKEAASVLKYLL